MIPVFSSVIGMANGLKENMQSSNLLCEVSKESIDIVYILNSNFM